jgi:hypothetical protein
VITPHARSTLNPVTDLIDIEMRFENIRYCIPDIFCMLGNPGMKLPEPPRPHVTSIGIYGEIREIGED